MKRLNLRYRILCIAASLPLAGQALGSADSRLDAGIAPQLLTMPIHLAVYETTEVESAVRPAERYLDAELQAVRGLEDDLDELANTAEAAATRLLAGGNLWLAGEPGMIAELAGRAGGLCGAKVLPTEKPAAILGVNDVVLWSAYGAREDMGSVWPRLLESGALVVAFAPEDNAVFRNRLPAHVRGIRVKVPMQDATAKQAIGHRRRMIVPAIATAEWTFVAELLGAVRRHHRQLAVYLSIHLDPGMRRFKRTNGLLMEPDMHPEPIGRRVYGGRFLARVRDGLEAIRREEMTRLCQAGDWLSESRAAHRRILRNLQGHLPPCEAGQPGDADFFGSAKPISLAGKEGERWARENLHAGDIYLLLGYQENEDAVASAAHFLNARTIFITSQGPGPEQSRNRHHLYVNPHWPRSDGCLALEGYDVKACPLSAILGLGCYNAICEEVDAHR